MFHMAQFKARTILFALLSIAFIVHHSHGIAVMSIDIGSEWMKVAIVSPGVPMEIALNKESKRKTPVTLSFRNGERTFGEDAQVVGLRFPQNSFSYLLDLIGKSIDNPMVELHKKRFPYHEIIADDAHNTIAFKLDGNTTYTPVELLAQILHKGKEFAENSAGQKINEAVLTVPGYFNQAERKALIQAAELADLRVLQLINDYTAVALNYGIFHRKEINDTTHYIMFYDMGASSTTATVVGYQNVKTKEKGFVETHPQVSILGVGYDRALGGLEMQIRLQQYLAKEFDAMKKTPNSVFNNDRAMAKLLKEAGRVKIVLSANADHYAQIEGLLDEQDFKLQVTRGKLEELCADLYEQVANPVKAALDTSGLSMSIISQVVLVGGGTRSPKVQEKLIEHLKTELSKNINTDEASALGAVYKAADLSQGFKVKKFITKDAVIFPIQVVFDRTSEGKTRQVKRTLFNKMNAYPQKKIITFNKYTDDFDFNVNYAELDHISPKEIERIGNLNISSISLTGVAEAIAKHPEEGVESKGIKAHFSLDDSGILNLVNVELVLEKSIVGAESSEEGTFSKLGSTISKLFTGSDDKESEKIEESSKEDVKPVHEEPDYPGLQKEADEKAKKNETKQTEDKSSNKTEKAAPKEKTPTIVTVKEPINAAETILTCKNLEGDALFSSREKIQALNVHDMAKRRRENALNNLESFVIDTQQKLESDEYALAATKEEVEEIKKACSEISEWLYEDGFDSTADVYEDKLENLQKLTRDVYERVFEHKERPDVLKGMLQMLNGSNVFLNNMRNLSVSSEIFTAVEIETLEKAIVETKEYYEIVVKASSETPLHEPVKYKVRDIANKMSLLDREVKYLVNKAKIWKPKETANQTDSATNKSESNSDSKESSAAEDEVKPSEDPDDTVVTLESEETSEKPDTEKSEKSETKQKDEESHQEL